MFLVEVDAGDAGVVHLLEEFLQVRPPLVIHPCSGKEPACVSALEDADTEIYVLSETHPREAAECFVDLAAYSHIEAPRIELVHFLFPAANTAGGEERSHGVVDGFLHIGKKRHVSRSGPPNASAGVFAVPLPLLQNSLREGCSRNPVLSGILPGCVLRHNCAFVRDRSWAWRSGCPECPDNALQRPCRESEEPSSTMMTSKSLNSAGSGFAKARPPRRGGCIRE